ncbi:hypothetical protein CANARDRAFT_28389 [[Candida] arabinofermentans NRRL YB-2248]|uniref:Uncharacterized protein n=1 Tax=[Candida] arabinofermentans NRRL YB-2248 TaxID=983967 RepID=A0A1E4T1M8_9ASCO|nr:hypothetical protein CANARDRAFT_28389 [[Candida] arabinofermentans NRRL YB-2248]
MERVRLLSTSPPNRFQSLIVNRHDQISFPFPFSFSPTVFVILIPINVTVIDIRQ